MITIQPATYEQVKLLCDCKKSVRAIACMDDERLLGVAGVNYDKGYQLVFSNISEELKSKPRMMIKAWNILKAMIEERKLPAIAQCDMSIPKSELFLLHLGFEPYDNNFWIRRT